MTPCHVFSAKKTSAQGTSSGMQGSALSSYPADFSKIAERALSYTLQKNYIQAVNEFSNTDEKGLNAWTTGKATWEAQNSEQKVQYVQGLLQDLDGYIQDYKILQTQISIIQPNLETARNINTITPLLNRLCDIRNKIFSIGLEIQKQGSYGYPLNLYRFINGVPEEKYSGVTGTIDAQWDEILKNYDTFLINQTEAENKNLEQLINANSLFESVETGIKANAIAKNISRDLNSRKKILELNKKINAQNGKTKYDIQKDKENEINQLIALISEESELLDITVKIAQDRLTNLQKPADAAKALRTDDDLYSEDLVTKARSYVTYGNIAAVASKSKNTKAAEPFAGTFLKLCSKIEQFTQNTAINYWVKAADLFAEASDLFYAEYKNLYDSCIAYTTDSQNGLYATRCLDAIKNIEEPLAKDIEILKECRSKMNDAYAYRANFINQQTKIEENDNNLKKITKEFEKISNQAKQLQVTATAAKNEVNIYYDRAKEFHKAENFEKSYDNLQKAQAAYNLKLPELRNDMDILEALFKDLTELRTQIIEKERPVYMSELKKIKANARTEYYAGNFEDANLYITEADTKRSTWSKLVDVELEEDVELERLKAFVNTALAIKEGREIPDWDAKAPELKQNISSAKKLFNMGTKAIDSGNTAKGNEYLSQARDLINLVKIYYPRNKDASLLSLKIEQFIDKDTFDMTFAARYQGLASINFNDRSVVAIQAYTDLLDLQELKPNYPGIKETITNAEISLGLRQRPVSQANSTQADKYCQEAQRLINRAGRDTVMLQEARELAQKALELNPQSTQAITLLDEIALRTGGQSAVTLSATDEVLYQEALLALQRNQVIEARSKLELILKTKGNENSAKVIKLKKRIEAQL